MQQKNPVNTEPLHRVKQYAADQNRTDDTGIFSPLLYRLSYSGTVLNKY